MIEDSGPDAEQKALPTDGGRAEALEIRDFVEPAVAAPPQTNSSWPFRYPNEGPACWYCAVVEALGWTAAVPVVQIITSIVVTIGFVILAAITTGPVQNPSQNPVMQNPVMMELVMAATLGIFVLTTLLAYWLRYYGRVFRELNMSAPDPRHLMIVVVGMVPLSLCVSLLSTPIQLSWNYLVEIYPFLKILDGVSSMEMLKDLAKTMPLFVMILLFAVTPAISEEVVFRGAVGRVLISNLGLWNGVLLTSILFGLVHIHPVHALAVIPMGVALHCIYLATRSFWMPMLLHFLNNAWASYAAQSNLSDPLQDGAELTRWQMIQMTSAVFAVVLLGVALWQSRVRLFHADGTEWKSGRFPLRVPAATDVHRKAASINLVCLIMAMACVIVCHLAVAGELWYQPAPANEDGIQVRTNLYDRLSFQTDIEIVA